MVSRLLSLSRCITFVLEQWKRGVLVFWVGDTCFIASSGVHMAWKVRLWFLCVFGKGFKVTLLELEI